MALILPRPFTLGREKEVPYSALACRIGKRKSRRYKSGVS